ncbi:MAG: peptide chain release factor N(5)-glutamine methyltransferase, partial [Phycisphaerae bacterium]|nr:peptide chain release factor N(5)-glutamine methyltransferase [Phycisphaerae bacterium]
MSEAAENWTVLRLINWTKDYFARSGIDEPRLAAEVLLGHVLACPRVALYTQFDRIVEAEHLSGFRGLIRQA